MTPHPESVVAKLRALMQRADEVGFDPPHYAAQVEYEEAVMDTVPALLAALEKVWDHSGDPVDVGERMRQNPQMRAATIEQLRGRRLAQEQIRTILAPLFLAPEK